MRAWKATLGAGALLALGAVGDGLAPAVRAEEPAQELTAQSVLGELRARAAEFLWLRVEQTLHQGVEVREASADAAHAAEGEPGHVHSAACQHDHDAEAQSDCGHEAVIKSAKCDFRGVLGHLEREVQPYFAPGQHAHGDPNQTIPLYRLMVELNPQFVPAYTSGAAVLGESGAHAKEALVFLHEGERANPVSIEIQTELGHYYAYYLRDYPSAERHLRRGLEIAARKELLTQDETEARIDGYRWLALTYQYWAKPEQAVTIAQEGRRLIGADVVLERVLRTGGA